MLESKPEAARSTIGTIHHPQWFEAYREAHPDPAKLKEKPKKQNCKPKITQITIVLKPKIVDDVKDHKVVARSNLIDVEARFVNDWLDDATSTGRAMWRYIGISW